MSFHDLLEWIRSPGLSESDPQRGRHLVKAARAEIDEGDPRDDLLYEIEVELYGGKVPVALLRELDERYGEELPYGNRLEIEYRRLAMELPESEWLTTFYAQAQDAVKFARDGQPDRFHTITQEMHEAIVKAWEPYAKTSLTEEDVTAETVVGHLLLRDGVEGWLEALDQLERAFDGEGTYEEGLSTAERANRLMVAMQMLSQKVQESTPTNALEDAWT
jgi:hypothetical protein